MAGLHEQNLELNRVEHELQHAHLRSMPRCLGVVLSNRCNIGCVHCYQPKNGDSLLEPRPIGEALRREFASLYPYVATVRLQGGELFAIPGFSEMLDDVGAVVDRPIVSISTNATLIDEGWAERIVRTPLQNVTVSIDAAHPDTFARLRRGSRLEDVLANIRRIQRWKEKLGSKYPYIDSFFVVMRSNFREIPEYVRMMRELGLLAVSLQTLEITPENSSRFPMLGQTEAITDGAEVLELHRLVRETMERERPRILIRTSGLTILFEQHGLDAEFVAEEEHGLYPDADTATTAGRELCPNPWTTLFVIENGDVHLCFLSEPVGNLYEEPLISIWNSPRAVAKRSRMATGRYRASGCSPQWCGWREGSKVEGPSGERRRQALLEFETLSARAFGLLRDTTESCPELASVRRKLQDRSGRISELEALFQELCRTNQETNDRGQAHIDQLESYVRQLESEVERLRHADLGLWVQAWSRLKGWSPR
ncbi:MAG TPA: radical SAM protein [Bryobacteraceae bacterium]|nr:radical SAM protein [Bryobacteraceae bacterium]